jgi:heptosyltransferase I
MAGAVEAPVIPPNPKRICLVRLSALGDVCLTVPLVRTLQKAFPEAQITWVTTRPMLQLVEGLDGVEFVVAEKAAHPLAHLAFYRRMRHRSFDVLLAAQASFRAHFLYPAIRAAIKIGFNAAEARDFHGWFVNRHLPERREHLLDSFLSFARALGAPKPVLEWRLPLTEQDHRFAEERLAGRSGPWIAINPTASKPERNWQPERFAELIDQCVRKWNCNVVLTGGPNKVEQLLGEALEAVHRERVLNLIGKTTPKEVAAVLGRVKVLIAPDTGPVHIATAMGTPVIGLYAVAPPELSGPYFSQHLVVNRFPEAVQKILGKDPQEVPWKTRVKSPKAMDLITVKHVLANVEQVLGSPVPA